MFLLRFLLVHQKNFFHQSIHWSLLSQLFGYNSLKKRFYHLHFQMIKQIIYWIVQVVSFSLFSYFWYVFIPFNSSFKSFSIQFCICYLKCAFWWTINFKKLKVFISTGNNQLLCMLFLLSHKLKLTKLKSKKVHS